MNEVIFSLVLGIIQGITEWLPISSSGFLVLIMTNIFKISDVGQLLQQALFLHLGTLLAATIYFRKDVLKIFKVMFKPRTSSENSKKIFSFLFISTLISGIIGLIFFKFITSFESTLLISGKTITFFVGGMLLITGFVQLKIKSRGTRETHDLKKSDGIILGLAQGLAFLPGLSRSGITISSLLLKKFDNTTALKLSFLMSIPIVLIGNIVMNLGGFAFSSTSLYALAFSFIFGILTIHGLMKLSKKINFGWFIIIFAILMMLSIFI
ncbi:undecaprenyl-diphosphate phosphatase [Candidatus Pacearchaeota archaeon]|nr:undecaprenyl-diphosphate phosphatase [Candidatus Pacearchaeota archaeon]